jgi:hypothetical protein
MGLLRLLWRASAPKLNYSEAGRGPPSFWSDYHGPVDEALAAGRRPASCRVVANSTVELTPFGGHPISTGRKESTHSENETTIFARVPATDRRPRTCRSHA